jgi:very-short-patch-repair endonuclease
VAEGKISNGSQENETEARAVVQHLSKLVTSEDYSGASIGVICLFEEQAALLQELVAEQIPEGEWEEHALVVVTPDGFQGDERDIILYSLSWDNDIMPRQALSQRQRNHPHEQGMLNVAFTRARDEIHIFHSAPIDTFTLADGRPGALTCWIQHCAAVQAAGRPEPAGSRMGQVDSEFEAEVASALRQRGIFVLHQYPACGFHIDLVCDREGARVAVECDGERYHLDEHGQPKLEDLEREAILRRAGWRIVRIPYRKWLRDSAEEVRTVLAPGDPIRGKRWCSSSTGEGLEYYRYTGGNSKIPPRGSYRRGAHSISRERSPGDAPPDHAVPARPSWRVAAAESAWTCCQGRSRVFPYS